MLRVFLGVEEWKMTLQYSLFGSVYNGTRQYKDKMDLTFLQSNQVQLSAKEKKIKIHCTNQALYTKSIEAG